MTQNLETASQKPVPGNAPVTSADSSPTKSNWLALIWILATTTAVVAWVLFAACRIEASYLKNYGFFYDPAAYYVHDIDLFRLYQDQGLWAALQYELVSNAKFPARTIPYLLLAPQQLTTVFGHLWTEAPLMWAFLMLFATTVFQRSKSLLLAISTTALFAGIPFLYDPSVGTGAYWLDFPAACALGSAALSLIRYGDTKHKGWMLAFGLFASLTALCRWSSGFYLLAFLGLAAPLVLLKAHWQRWGHLSAALGCALLTALPGITFTLYYWAYNTDYYKRFGFAFGAPISKSIIWTFATIYDIMGPVIMGITALFICANVVAACQGKSDKLQVFLCTWLPLSIFLFVTVVVKAVDGIHPLVYFAPTLFVAAFCPVSEIALHRARWRASCALLLVAAIGTAAYAYDSKRRMAAHPPPPLKIKQQCNLALADLIVSTNAHSFTEFDDETVFPHMEVFFNHGRYCAWIAMFSTHEMYMKEMVMNKGKTPEQIAVLTYNKTKQEVELVAVFSDPRQAFKPDVFDNRYTAIVSSYMSKTIQDHPQDWKLVGHAESLRGPLSVYKNLHYAPK